MRAALDREPFQSRSENNLAEYPKLSGGAGVGERTCARHCRLGCKGYRLEDQTAAGRKRSYARATSEIKQIALSEELLRFPVPKLWHAVPPDDDAAP